MRMDTTNTQRTLGGWRAPCTTFDYRKMEGEAQQECNVLQQRLKELKACRPKDADTDLLLRREISVLTDIYYEQRHQARLFHRKAEEREAAL